MQVNFCTIHNKIRLLLSIDFFPLHFLSNIFCFHCPWIILPLGLCVFIPQYAFSFWRYYFVATLYCNWISSACVLSSPESWGTESRFPPLPCFLSWHQCPCICPVERNGSLHWGHDWTLEPTEDKWVVQGPIAPASLFCSFVSHFAPGGDYFSWKDGRGSREQV